MQKSEWGWNAHLEQEYESLKNSGLFPGRVIRENRHIYHLASDLGLVWGEVSGAFQYRAAGPEDFPVVGDWVLFRPAGAGEQADEPLGIIESLMTRQSRFSRKVTGNKTEEQIMAANVDKIYIVFGLDGGRNFQPGALERYLSLASENRLPALVVLNKADLLPKEDRDAVLRQVEKTAPGSAILFVSAKTGEGLEDLKNTWRAGMTIIVVGPSGVGKSSILNNLAGGELQRTQNPRAGDLRGKHTTTTREMFFLSSGVMYIDSPGIKEIQLWGSSAALDEAFLDIARLAENCRFRDCRHQDEPGCAVREALESGELEPRRYKNYLALLRELKYLETRQDDSSSRKGKLAVRLEKDKWKKIHKEIRNQNKERY